MPEDEGPMPGYERDHWKTKRHLASKRLEEIIGPIRASEEAAREQRQHFLSEKGSSSNLNSDSRRHSLQIECSPGFFIILYLAERSGWLYPSRSRTWRTIEYWMTDAEFSAREYVKCLQGGRVDFWPLDVYEATRHATVDAMSIAYGKKEGV